MNHRHIQAFLAVSATFFAMNAPLQAHAASQNNAPVARVARVEACGAATAKPTKANG
jgi:hypothetical protein